MIERILQGLASRLRRLRLRWRGADVPARAWLRAIEVPRHPDRLRIETDAALDRGVTLLISARDAHASKVPAILIGERAYLNRGTIIDAVDGVRIGADAMIGPYCYITDHDHSFGTDGRPASGPLQGAPTEIGSRCWLGAHVTVLKGVRIGDGTIVGAGSVVTRDLPSGVVAVGNPARILRANPPT